MYDPHENKFVPLDEQMAKAIDSPTATPAQKIQRQWTRFSEGETVEVKGFKFHVHEIGERRLILKTIDRNSFAGEAK
jgi:hypothetical protein